MKKKTYKIKKSSKLMKQLKPFLTTLSLIEDVYWSSIQDLDKKLAKATGIKDIELFHSDGSVVGIGNASRTMELIQRDELELFKG